MNRVPQPGLAPVSCPFWPHPKRPQRVKADSSVLEPQRVTGRVGGRTWRLLPVPCSKRPHPGPQKGSPPGPGLALRKARGPRTTCSRGPGPSDAPQLLVLSAASPWEEKEEPAPAGASCLPSPPVPTLPTAQPREATPARGVGVEEGAPLERGICWCFLRQRGGPAGRGALTGSPGTEPPGPCGSPGRDRGGGAWCWRRRS